MLALFAWLRIIIVSLNYPELESVHLGIDVLHPDIVKMLCVLFGEALLVFSSYKSEFYLCQI